MFIVGCYSYYISSSNHNGEDEMNTTFDTGNNEQISIGIYKNNGSGKMLSTRHFEYWCIRTQ